MQRALFIGGGGFLGSHAVERWLSKSPDKTAIVLDAMKSTAGHGRLKRLISDKRLQVVTGDIRDESLVYDLLLSRVDHVFNFATGIAPQSHATDRREGIDSMAAGSQALIETIARLGDPKPSLTLAISTAPWGSNPKKTVGHGVSLRPDSFLGVAETLAMEVTLGFCRELNVAAQVGVAPTAFGPGQRQGPVAEVIKAMLGGQRPSPTERGLDWKLIYAPDLVERLIQQAEKAAGTVRVWRLPGEGFGGFEGLVASVGALGERFFMANPSLRERFPEANWRGGVELKAVKHTLWPEHLSPGQGSIVAPVSPPVEAMAETLRWYLSNPDDWREPAEHTQRASGW